MRVMLRTAFADQLISPSCPSPDFGMQARRAKPVFEEGTQLGVLRRFRETDEPDGRFRLNPFALSVCCFCHGRRGKGRPDIESTQH